MASLMQTCPAVNEAGAGSSDPVQKADRPPMGQCVRGRVQMSLQMLGVKAAFRRTCQWVVRSLGFWEICFTQGWVPSLQVSRPSNAHSRNFQYSLWAGSAHTQQ